MKRSIKNYLHYLVIACVLILSTSCAKDNEDVEPQRGIQRSELIITAMSADVTAHGDHFHGIAKGTEKESITVKFDNNGQAVENGHLHLDANVVYKIQLKVFDYENKEIQHEYIANKEVANSYKAFLVGDKLKLNDEQEDFKGSIFYPRDLAYSNGQLTDTYNVYELTGILSYFIIGEDNAKETQKLSYVLRKFADPSIKSKVELKDLIRPDYFSVFHGTDILNLKFEVHAGSH